MLETWSDGNIFRGAPNHEVKQRFDHMVLKDHEVNKNHYTSNTRVPLDISLARMITFLDVLLSIKSHDPLLAGPCITT